MNNDDLIMLWGLSMLLVCVGGLVWLVAVQG